MNQRHQPHRYYDPSRDEQRQSTIIAFTCGIILGLLGGVIATLAILNALGEI